MAIVCIRVHSLKCSANLITVHNSYLEMGISKWGSTKLYLYGSLQSYNKRSEIPIKHERLKWGSK